MKQNIYSIHLLHVILQFVNGNIDVSEKNLFFAAQIRKARSQIKLHRTAVKIQTQLIIL